MSYTLWAAWQDFNQIAKENDEKRTNEIFAQVKQAACKELVRSAARFARLGKYDEYVYAGLSLLMGIYSHVLEEVNDIQQQDATVKVLLDGVCEVLVSRLKEFEDAGVKAKGSNPISKEKGKIFGRNAKELSRRINSERENPNYLPIIFTHFAECLSSCLAELDDLPTRKITSMYMQLMQREWEELGNIIKVQVLALENAIAESVDPADTSEFPTLHRILNTLREAYQHTGPIIAELQKLLSATPVPHVGITFEEFAALMPVIEATEPEQTHPFFQALDNQLVTISHQLKSDLPAAVCQMQCIINTDKQLADDIVQAFSTLKAALPLPDPQHENADETQLAILGGIIETIDIKIESMQDSIKTFDEEGADLLRRFTEEKPLPSDSDISAAQEFVRTAWLNSPPESENDIDAFFATTQEDAFANLATRIGKYIASSMDKVKKFAFRFKKETLLYEVCTYEEILTHSVSRLRGSNWEDMANAAILLDDAYNVLETLLKENNITAIRPAAHEPFNAFEHDVLMAEKTEGFSKGEIVKIINTGYKQDETVILRANVIAAR